MIKKILILVGAAATTAGVVAAVTLPGEAQQRTAYLLQKYTPPVFDDSYNAGMRIIHIPQGRASASAAPAAPPSYREDDVDIAPEAAPKARKQVIAPQPRRVLPPAGETKRTVLKVPNEMHDGPNPVRPLPRWRSIEKFTELPKPANPAPVADAVAAPIPVAPASDAGAPPAAN